MRLVGATPGQISVLSAVESTVAAVAGTAVGFLLFLLLRPLLAAIPFTGAPFYPASLTPMSTSMTPDALSGKAFAVAAWGQRLVALRRSSICP